MNDSIAHLDFDILCESATCRDRWARQEHQAEYLLSFSCGCDYTWCKFISNQFTTCLMMGQPQNCPGCDRPTLYATVRNIPNVRVT